MPGTCFNINSDKGERLIPSTPEWAPVTAEATRFVTDVLLQADHIDQQFQIVNHVSDFFSKTIDEFAFEYGIDRKHIKFAFKGGNTMRFIMRSLARSLTSITEDIWWMYSSVFAASDLDFTVSIDYERIGVTLGDDAIMRLSTRLHHTMRRLRESFTYPSIVQQTFPLIKLSEEAFRVELEEVFDRMNEACDEHKLPEIHALSCMNIRVPRNAASTLLDQPVRKSFIVKQPPEQDEVQICEFGGSSPLYTSLNTTLRFPVNPEETLFAHFNLVRMKLNMDIEVMPRVYMEDTEYTLNEHMVKKSIGGEIIDITVAYPDDSSMTSTVFKRVRGSQHEPDDVYVEYTVEHHDKQNRFARYEITSYSLPSLIQDICRVLFIEPNDPWDNNKYKKRIKRLMGLMLCEALVEISQGRVSTRFMIECMSSVLSAKDFKADKYGDETVWEYVHSKFVKYTRLQAGGESDKDTDDMLLTVKNLLRTNIDILNKYGARSEQTTSAYHLYLF